MEDSFVGKAMGILAYLMLILPVILLVSLVGYLAHKFSKDRLIWLVTKIKDKLFWNFFIRYSMTSYLSLGFDGFTALKSLRWKNGFSCFSSVAAIIVAVTLIALPIFFYSVLMRNRENLETLRVKIGNLYSGIRIEKKSQLVYVVIFFVKRLAFALTVLSLSETSPLLLVNLICL